MSIQCVERGSLLSKLRHHYVALIARIPQHVYVIQQELDATRKLTQQLRSHQLDLDLDLDLQSQAMQKGEGEGEGEEGNHIIETSWYRTCFLTVS